MVTTVEASQGTSGYFPRWTVKTGGVIMPEERLPWAQTIISGLQHSVAMAGATIVAPIIMGFDPSVALFYSGVGTLIFFLLVGGRVPSYLGSSFSFIAVVIAASAYSGHGPNPGLDVALGGIVAAGVVYGLMALIVMGIGSAWLEHLMPPVVTGAVVAVIGLNLAPVAVKAVSGSQFDAWIALITVLIIGLIAVTTTGIWQRLPVIIGAAAGYVLYLLFTNGLGWGKPIDLTALAAAPWVGLPKFMVPSFHANAMFLIAPVAIILVAENLGHIKAIAAMTGRNLDAYLGRAFLGDSIATIVSAFGGDDICREHRCYGGYQGLFDRALHCGSCCCHPAWPFPQVRRPDLINSWSRHRRPVDCAVRSNCCHGRSDLGTKSGRLRKAKKSNHGGGCTHRRCRRSDAQVRRFHNGRHWHRDVRRHHPVSDPSLGQIERIAHRA